MPQAPQQKAMQTAMPQAPQQHGMQTAMPQAPQQPTMQTAMLPLQQDSDTKTAVPCAHDHAATQPPALETPVESVYLFWILVAVLLILLVVVLVIFLVFCQLPRRRYTAAMRGEAGDDQQERV
jgi:hypothetical protein